VGGKKVEVPCTGENRQRHQGQKTPRHVANAVGENGGSPKNGKRKFETPWPRAKKKKNLEGF